MANRSGGNSSSSSRGSGRRGVSNGQGDNPPQPIALPADAIFSNDGASVQFVNPFSTQGHVGLSELSATGLWAFVSANCGQQIASFQNSWIEKNLRGAILLRFHPADFDAELLREFPSMSVSIRQSLFNFVKLCVARDLAANHALKSYVDPSIGALWAASTFDVPVAKRLRDEAARGGGHDLLSPSKRTSSTFVFGSPIGISAPPFGGNAPPFGGNAPPFGGNAPPFGGNAPPFGGSAPPFGVNAPPFDANGSAQVPSIRVAPPPINFSASASAPIVGSASAPAVSNQLQQSFVGPSALLFDNSVPIPFHSLDQLSVLLRTKGANPKPWELASAIRPKLPADDFVPGFKRISMFALIEQAKNKAAARRARGEPVPHVQKDIVWPKMHAFTKQAFVKCRTKYYECVLGSLMSGIFSTFKECVMGSARSAAMRLFQLTEALYLDLEDNIFVDWLTIHFGPKHKAQALLALSEIQIGKHVDTADSQAVFVPKLDTVVFEFELCVNDIFQMAKYWPTDPQHEDYGELTGKEVMLKWLDCFPADKAASSVQIAFCRSFIQQNKDMLFDAQVTKIRDKFVLRDTRVHDGDLAYTTMPTKASGANITTRTPRSSAPSTVSTGQPRSGGSAAGTGTVTQRSGLPPRPASAQQTDRPRPRPGSAVAAPPSRTRVTPGHKRCKGCGAENNHWGLGYSKDSCPAWNTKYAVKAGFVWPDSDKMPKVNIPQPEYMELLRANPKIQVNWDKAKADKATARSSVMALNADDDDGDVSDYSDNYDEFDDVAAEHDDDDQVNDINCSSAARSPGAELAELSTADALDLLGNMQQFFGVSRLAGNDDFLAKTLMDPGATMNIISPLCCNRCMVDRRQVQVNIFRANARCAPWRK
jgi:hypothetical protein